MVGIFNKPFQAYIAFIEGGMAVAVEAGNEVGPNLLAIMRSCAWSHWFLFGHVPSFPSIIRNIIALSM